MIVKEILKTCFRYNLQQIFNYIKKPRNIIFSSLLILSVLHYLFIALFLDIGFAKAAPQTLLTPLSYVLWILYLIIYSLLDEKKLLARFYITLTIVGSLSYSIVLLARLLDFNPESLASVLPEFLKHILPKLLETVIKLFRIVLLFSGPICILTSLSFWISKRSNESKIFKSLLPAVLISIAVLIATVLVKTKPKAEKKMPPKRAELVNTQPLESGDETVVLQVTGTVTPSKKIRVRARVTGEVVQIADGFIDGGLLAENEAILKIDPVDFELALVQSASALEKARFDYKIELGRQDVAKREWELLKPEGEVSELEMELALRIPHLKASKAALQAAEANLKKAELNLARTEIKTPFNAVVLSRNVNLGSQAAQQDVLAELAGTDEYWITVSIPVDRIEWLTIPGSKARIYSGNKSVREGRVIKLLGDLEEKGRMARVLINVDDPLSLKPENAEKKPLLLGEYVRVEIDGRELDDVYSIPREALRENGQIWIATTNETLDIRTVDVLWRDASRVLIRDGLSNQDLLIVSDLTAPIHGMNVNTGTHKPDNASKKPAANKE
jgi:RND family efflux transporter MFP subunit